MPTMRKLVSIALILIVISACEKLTEKRDTRSGRPSGAEKKRALDQSVFSDSAKARVAKNDIVINAKGQPPVAPDPNPSPAAIVIGNDPAASPSIAPIANDPNA